MEIKSISLHELRKMNGSEGLILQGCGGNLQEWVDGINEMLTEAEILENGSKFTNCYSFQRDDLTCILFPFEDMQLNIGKLAMWRIQTHELFGGTWLTDYVPNRLGGFITENEQTQKKPDCPLIGADSNVFNLMGIASRTLRRNDMANEAKEMCSRVTSSGSYEEALGIIMEYVEPCSEEEINEESEEISMEMS